MSTARSILIIVNPTSGRGRALRMAETVAEDLGRRGVTATVMQTSARGEAERIAREASLDEVGRPSCVAGCGGDGTMQEVANALAPLGASLGEACPAMGVIPAGRCNDLARALGISKSSAAVAEMLATGEVRRIDLGRVNDRYFCTVATAGVDAEVSSYVDTMNVPLRGTAAYLFGAVRVLARYRPRKVRLSGAFGEIEQRVFLASSANTASYGGAIPIAPDAVPTDGQLDLCVINAVSKFRALGLMLTVLRGRHRNRSDVRFVRTARLVIESDEPMELWADGERVGSTPATIEAVPKAVRIVLPTGR